MTTHPKRVCVVRLTEDAVADLHRLAKKDPHIVRSVFKKMLLLERSPNAGEPLLGALIGFRKLVVGDRHWRIVWRVTEDTDGTLILDISEVWAVGVRSDSEVYEELMARVARIGDDPQLQPLKDVITQMGRLYESVEAAAEPPKHPAMPDWLQAALSDQLNLGPEQIAQMTEQQGQELLMKHWTGRRKI
ncbi:type II toxin-antitoxin system RelE family toxin [Arthrobacter sp. A2-55]|uniref:type II toxin-antitoxin system RelE family toxin n=1 Tax=Arthrobacter sp. A2-55 TaxID=2897337 RepID=UPI0021CD3E99|nr:type II toxin-antitoxin system RelE/ParE family toxin [Arthrobacter sp. A2-55]MCU6479893.1 type II toxin-antitoxin system RelE/ParE family toxin [Arthrobacter sp. A2-55]